jgi:lipopolysaccharide export system protein LptA
MKFNPHRILSILGCIFLVGALQLNRFLSLVGLVVLLGLFLVLGANKVSSQDLPSPGEAAGTSSSSSPSTTPKVINPTTRDPELEALPDAPAGDTVITSPLANMDQNQRTVVCTANQDGLVYVVGNDFRMRCLEVTAYFNAAHKVDHLEADGRVVIEQPNRLTKAGHATFTQADNQIVLTKSPQINDNGNITYGTTIIIYRGKGTMFVQHSTIVLPPSTTSSKPSPTPTP